MAHERRLGYGPHDVPSEKRGYGIESRDPETGDFRFIEVKGRRADTRAATITRNEMPTALNAAASFILVVVRVEEELVHRPLYMTNPVLILGLEPGFAGVSPAVSVAPTGRSAELRP